MIQTFVEKNSKLLRFYYWAARLGGWFLIAFALLQISGHSIALVSRINNWEEFLRYFNNDLPGGIFSEGLATGLIALGVAQLIWYLLQTDSRPGWLLRHADKLLYIYTFILIGYYSLKLPMEVIAHYHEPYDFPLRLIISLVFIVIKLLALVGIAQILKRLLPTVEESRTLV